MPGPIPAVFLSLYPRLKRSQRKSAESSAIASRLAIERKSFGNRDPHAQSSGPAVGSAALQIEIPNGLGSEVYPGAPRIYLNDEGAISPPI